MKLQYPGPQQAKDVTAISLRRQIGGDVRPAILMLFGAVGFLLLIVCVNVANLLMVRWTARSHEIALRIVVGASWQDMLRKLLTESLVLAGAGGAFGVCSRRCGRST